MFPVRPRKSNSPQRTNTMKICLLMGSPHLEGTTAALAEAFSEGARAAGHEVERIDVETLTIEPCTNALLERLTKGEDVDTDGMAKVFASLLKADAVVLATPLYYYGMTAQLKAVVDRFVSRNDEVAAKGLKAVLLAVAAGPAPEAMEPLSAQFRAICGYLKWTNAGQVFGLGLAMRPLEETGALDEARKLGASL